MQSLNIDLCHCELEDASALEYLPTVTMLDISHNRLRLLPRLSPTATYSLSILIANNNLISHISGLHDMSNIEELDLRDNVLCMNDVLSPIGALPHLRILQISGNPLAWDINYRIHTIRLMNPATAITSAKWCQAHFSSDFPSPTPEFKMTEHGAEGMSPWKILASGPNREEALKF
ncbi:geranylgeranyl transferase type-2 subunit alpha-like [Penaeus monodon]|uniref:geranylgeranyl transferase type-2 subunit alpha-like n=1 Tax=Penaeus monodon TaxID=6687 RepID=UPI0018A6D881|nr:geranylgeranyl transferase type-2 subunit alpha-like [Penaeus monodon]